MDQKQLLINSIIERLPEILLNCDENVSEVLLDAMNRCNYERIKLLNNQLFCHISNMDADRNKQLIDVFCKEVNDIAVAASANIEEEKHTVNGGEENICLSSDDEFSSCPSSVVYTDEDDCRPRRSRGRPNGLLEDEDDSDIEIISACDNGAGNNVNGSRYNMRKRRASNEGTGEQQQQQHYKQSRYEFRDRKYNTNNNDRTNVPEASDRKRNNDCPNSNNSNKPKENDIIIQIEDSSSDEDVQEIRREAPTAGGGGTTGNDKARYANTRPAPGSQPNNNNNNSNNHNNLPRQQPAFKANYHRHHPPTQPDPSQLASIPLVVQFPTMQSATFNGHLYISHNHKFSVKLQGVDPTNFRWN